MNPISLALILHAHQPVGNFEDVIERSYQRSYLPFLNCLERHPAVSINLHYSGVLLEWIERSHPEYLDRLRKLREAGRVEMWGGGFYEPILISIPEPDRQAQIGRLRDYAKKHFGESPRGAWLTERVWEPELPQSLAGAKVEYTLADDTHFLCAGAEPEDLYGYYSTECNGQVVKIIPGSKALRYVIPWRPVAEVVAMFSQISEKHPNSLIAMGDDLEKFGDWPQTYRSVYEEHWLEDFFSALESNRSWLRSTRTCDYLDAHAPLGRIYLPTGSYREMTEWWMPCRAAEIYEEAHGRLQAMEDGERYLRFLNGGSWRNFLSKYSEANLLHKQMLAVSRRFQSLKSAAAGTRKAAYAHLLAAQCNDTYWHGVFGGLYAPHLRHAVYTHLLQADAALDKMEKAFDESPVRSRHFDLTLNGRPELEVRSRRVNFLVRPSDGATVAAIHYKPRPLNLVNTIRRRPEVYHKKLPESASIPGSGESQSIHNRVLAKEDGLSRYLQYDRYDRNTFRNYLFAAGKTFEDFAALRLEESPEWAGAEYALAEQGKADWLFVRSGPLADAAGNSIQLLVEKQFQLDSGDDDDHIRCLLRIKCLQGSGRFRLGLELVLNLLAGHAPDRYYAMPGWQESLDWRGELQQPKPLALVDEWLKVSMLVTPSPACDRWWLCPTFSVSQSDAGFEKIYQGSGIMPVWDVNLMESATWEASVDLALHSLS